MKNFSIYFLGTAVLQFIVILITGNLMEDRDINAASMFIIVFFFPGVLVSVGFGLMFSIINQLRSNYYFFLWVTVLLVLSISLNELIESNGKVVVRVILISGFLYNLIIFIDKRTKSKNKPVSL
jgi:hypothetical protein